MVQVNGYDEDETEVLAVQLTAIIQQCIKDAVAATVNDFLAKAPIVASSSAGMGPQDISTLTDNWLSQVDGQILPFLGQVYTGSAVGIAVGLADGFPDDALPGVPLVPDEWQQTFLKTVAPGFIGIGDDVFEDVRNVVMQGVAAGESTDQIAAKMQHVTDFTTTRATGIARTMTHSAAESGSIAQMRFVGYTDEQAIKEWLCTHDRRTRPTHLMADTQQVPLSQKFHVGSTELDYPGDPSGDWNEVQGCRCTTVYTITDTPAYRCEGDFGEVLDSSSDESAVDEFSAAAATATLPDASACVSPAPTVDVSMISDGDKKNISQVFDQVNSGGVTPAYSGAAIYKVVQATEAQLASMGFDTTQWSDWQILKVIDDTHPSKGASTFTSKFTTWAQSPPGKKALPNLKFPATHVVAPIAPTAPPPVVHPPVAPTSTYKPHLLEAPSQSSFKILSDPGASGDGYTSTGKWGLYGASGVLIRSEGEDGVERFLLIQRGEKYKGKTIYDASGKATGTEPGKEIGKWQLPGGGLDKLDDPYTSAARELFEETGASKDYISKMIPVGESVKTDESGWSYTTIGAHAPTQFTPQTHGSTGDAKWFTADEIKTMVSNDQIVGALKDQLVDLVDDVNHLSPVKPLGSVSSLEPTPLPPVAPKPKPHYIHFTGKTLGSHGAQVWKNDKTGDLWLFKPQKQYATDIDIATAKLQSIASQTRPGVYEIELDGQKGSIQYMFKSKEAFPHGSFDPLKLSPADIETLQEGQIFDWLISNFDTHSGQWIRLQDGHLFGTDKGQAFKFFGQDKLDWNYVPVYPLGDDKLTYSAMWQDFVTGKDIALQDPTTGVLGAYIDRLMSIPDDQFRALFQSYADAKGKPTPEAFLDALVARKNNLKSDFKDFWDRAVAERSKYVKVPVAPPPAVPAVVNPLTPGGVLTPTMKHDIWEMWEAGSGGKKVTPGWGGAKIYKMMKDIRDGWVEDVAAGNASFAPDEMQILKALDEMGGFIGKPKTYESVVMDWLNSPAGAKAVPAPPTSLVKLPPLVTPVTSPSAGMTVSGASAVKMPTADLSTFVTGKPVTDLKDLTGYAMSAPKGETIAYGVDSGTGWSYKISKSKAFDDEVEVFVSQNGKTWKHLDFYPTGDLGQIQSDLSADSWTGFTPKGTPTSKIPGKMPGDMIDSKAIQASKYLWSDGDVIATAEDGSSGTYILTSMGNGDIKLSYAPSHGSTAYPIFVKTFPASDTFPKTMMGSIKEWKLGPDAVTSAVKQKPSSIVGHFAGEKLSTADILGAQVVDTSAGSQQLAYAYNASNDTEYVVWQYPDGTLKINYKTASMKAFDTAMDQMDDPAGFKQFLESGAFKDGWYAATKNGGAPDAYKLSLPGGSGKPVPGTVTPSLMKGKTVGDNVTLAQIKKASTGNEGDILATHPGGATVKNARIVVDHDGNLIMQTQDPSSLNWKTIGHLTGDQTDLTPSMIKDWKDGWVAASGNTPLPAVTPLLDQTETAFTGLKVGQQVDVDQIFNEFSKFADGQVIAQLSMYGEKYRLVVVDGQLVQQKLNQKTGKWVGNTLIKHKYDIQANYSYSSYKWKVYTNTVDKKEMPALKKYVDKQLTPKSYVPKASTYTPPATAAPKAPLPFEPAIPSGYTPVPNPEKDVFLAPHPPTPPPTVLVPKNLDMSGITDTVKNNILGMKKIMFNSDPELIFNQMMEVLKKAKANGGAAYQNLTLAHIMRIYDEARDARNGLTTPSYSYEKKVVEWWKKEGYLKSLPAQDMRFDAPVNARDLPPIQQRLDAPGLPDPDSQKYITIDDAEAKQLQQDMEAKYGSLSSEQKSSVSTYTGGSYREINHTVRDGTTSSAGSSGKTAYHTAAAMRPSTIALQLRRDTGWSDFFDTRITSEAELQKYVGRTFAWRRFVSSTISTKHTYSTKSEVIFHIQAPIGTPMVYASRYGTNPGELEMLLGPHTMFKIQKVEQQGTKCHVWVRIVGVADPRA